MNSYIHTSSKISEQEGSNRTDPFTKTSMKNKSMIPHIPKFYSRIPTHSLKQRVIQKSKPRSNPTLPNQETNIDNQPNTNSNIRNFDSPHLSKANIIHHPLQISDLLSYLLDVMDSYSWIMNYLAVSHRFTMLVSYALRLLMHVCTY